MAIFPTVRKGVLPILLAISYSGGAATPVSGVEPSSLPAADPGREATRASQPVLLTVVLKHDQSKPLPDIINQVKKQGFYDKFPPKGVEVVSWYVWMGVGQVITLKVPAEKLREVNRALEESAWGGFRTEVYATYDYMALGKRLHAGAFAQ
ncbi:hypothetical protein [Burkholderia ubonensis]|uniref:hypothetical protein n=1 Tax=Burkholderia ubonensis TaxID=101571 RepID=UPI0009B46CAC|nr:hypothetical protein [Burkholderia ubonensis]